MRWELWGGVFAVVVGCSSAKKADIEPPPQEDAGTGHVGELGTPDLTVFADRARADFAVRQELFAADSCELNPDENCVNAPGLRTLLQFSIETPNIGDGDLLLGTPVVGDHFSYSECHMHFHYNGYAEYELRDQNDQVVGTGRKQAFCLTDSDRIDPDARPFARYNCSYQGIQAGWSDVYASDIDCQHLDITDVPPGEYTLRIAVNTHQTLMESNYDNNVVTMPVTIGDPGLATPTEACDMSLNPRVLRNTNRECGWQAAGTFACTPGEKIRVGCAAGCGLGSCTGDPMIRVCDDATGDNCTFADKLGTGTQGCLTSCPVTEVFTCPPSGQIRAFAAPTVPGAAFTCEVEVASITTVP